MTIGNSFAALTSRRLVVVAGAGGVGKTTSSASLGAALARDGRRVLVVTVDPARRLADSLGLAATAGNEIVEAPRHPGLSVTMLDTKAGWDGLVRRHARDETTAARILANPLYHSITSRFVNSHDYIAMERLHELSTDERFDVVVVDTPPSRNALDLLDAPRRMREFFAGRLLRWVTMPYRNRVLNLASRPLLFVADRVLGATFLADIAEFFTLLQTMEQGFVQRAREVEALLRSDQTAFTVVTTAEPAPAIEARHLLAELRRRGMHPCAVIVNKLPPSTVGSVVVPDPPEIAAVLGVDAERALRLHHTIVDVLAAAEAIRRRNNEVLATLTGQQVAVLRVESTSAVDPVAVIADRMRAQ